MNLTKDEKHKQCVKEIKWTLILASVCCIFHIFSAFLLNKLDVKILGFPLWFAVSVFGTIFLSLFSVIFLCKKIFIDFEYDEEKIENEGGTK